MPSLSGRRTVYDQLDLHLGEGWEDRSDFGRLPDLSQGRLLELYCDVFEFRPEPLQKPKADGLQLSLPSDAPITAITVSALHAHNVVLQFPLRQVLAIEYEWGRESAISAIRSWVNTHRTTALFSDASYDSIVSYQDLLAAPRTPAPPPPKPEEPVKNDEAARRNTAFDDEIDRLLDELDELAPFVPPKLRPIPGREALIQLFREDFLPKLAPLRYLIENEILRFYYPTWELLPHGGRLALRGCVETSLPFCRDLYSLLRQDDRSIPDEPPEDDGWTGRWAAVSGHIRRHYGDLVRSIADSEWATANQATMLATNERIFELARLFMVHFEHISDAGAFIGYPVHPRDQTTHADSELFRRFLTQAILSRWVHPQGLAVSTVIDLRRSEEAFAAWRSELAQRLPLIQNCRTLGECEDLIRDCDEGLRAREQEIRARISRFQARSLRTALSEGAIVATFSFLGTLGVTGDLKAALGAAAGSGLTTVGKNVPRLLSSDADFQGADLAIAKLALGRQK